MPTDDEILSVLIVWANRDGASDFGATPAAIRKLRALFAQPEPERMSVRLEIATRLLADLEIHPTRLGSNDIDAAFMVADFLIATDKKPRQ